MNLTEYEALIELLAAFQVVGFPDDKVQAILLALNIVGIECRSIDSATDDLVAAIGRIGIAAIERIERCDRRIH